MRNWKRYLELATFVFLLIAGNILSGATSDSEEKVVIVCFLEGKAWVLESTLEERNEVDLFDWMKVGEVIETSPETKMVLAFSNGERFELVGETKVTIGENDFSSHSGSVKKISPVSVMPQIASISKESRPGSRLGGIRLRGTKRVISGLYPSDGATVIADEAVLIFEPIEGVERYRIEIEDEWGNNIFSVETGSPKVVASPGVLKPKANYYWQVRTLEKDKPSIFSEAVFSTISEENARIRNNFKEQAFQSEDGVNLLLLAQIEMALGLSKEACETLKSALKLFPDNSEIQTAMCQIGCK